VPLTPLNKNQTQTSEKKHMERKTWDKTLVLVAVAACASWLSVGCKSSGYQQADKTGEGISDFRTEILNGKKAIDQTMAALDKVAASAATDPRAAYEEFSKSVANLDSTANKIRKRGQAMREQGKAYFTQWEQQLAQVKNPEIQQLATQRKAKLQEAFDNIKNVAEPLKTQFDPWMSDLKDLQTYLANDLTVTGVDAAKTLFKKAQTGGMEVQKSMDALIAELNTISATITAAKAQAAPPPEKK
jgi:predicted  nucleic acid-binding Zn-ribbon protein